MTGILIDPRVNIPIMIQQGDVVSWFDEPFTDVGGTLYQSSGYGLQYTLAGGPSVPLTVAAAAQGSGWLTTLSVAQTAALTPGMYWWQAVLAATNFASTVTKGELVVSANLAAAGAGYNGNSQSAQNLETWKAALAALSGTSGPPVQSYRINTREMRYQDIGDIIKAIAFWQAQVLKESTAQSIAQGQGNPRKLYARFPSRFGVGE